MRYDTKTRTIETEFTDVEFDNEQFDTEDFERRQEGSEYESLELSDVPYLLGGERAEESLMGLALLADATGESEDHIVENRDEIRAILEDDSRSYAERALAGYVLGEAGLQSGDEEFY